MWTLLDSWRTLKMTANFKRPETNCRGASRSQSSDAQLSRTKRIAWGSLTMIQAGSSAYTRLGPARLTLAIIFGLFKRSAFCGCHRWLAKSFQTDSTADFTNFAAPYGNVNTKGLPCLLRRYLGENARHCTRSERRGITTHMLAHKEEHVVLCPRSLCCPADKERVHELLPILATPLVLAIRLDCFTGQSGVEERVRMLPDVLEKRPPAPTGSEKAGLIEKLRVWGSSNAHYSCQMKLSFPSG
jgi:hypothetical protein